MRDVLAEICAEKRAHVARTKAVRSEAALLAGLSGAPPVRPFAAALEGHLAEGRYGLIAEVKKASPSAGLIRKDFDPRTLAAAYEAGGASCLSVLTDAPYFQGSETDLIAAREVVRLPVLRKDFILSPYQVLESRSIGADCILLIMAALSDAAASELAAAAAELGLDVLAEIHDSAELDRALRLPVRLIGINNRNLKTLETDLRTAETLAPEVPADRIVVAESGIRQSADLDRLAAAGARCFLVGETLMREPDVTAATRRLLGLPPDPGFTHLDAEGRARMVDISDKRETDRMAIAGARVVMRPETLERIRSGDFAKGDVLAVARLAGIMAAKRTAELIPLCHPLALTSVSVDLECVPELSAVEITATCRLRGRTGVEMEALTAASVAALTVYDMCKAVDRGMVVTDLRLLRKSGGNSGELGGRTVISVEEALSRLLAPLEKLPLEQISIVDALGRVLAEDVAARRTQPPFAASAMDGYAVRAEDLATIPVELRIVAEVPAGAGFGGHVGPREAARIFTGAPMPAGTDTIVIQEDTQREGDRVRVLEGAARGRHVRREGLDFGEGDVLLQAGRRLTARDIGLAAAMNRPWLFVHRRPRVGILSTGDEIVMPGDPIGPHQIVSSNSLALAAFVAACGGIPVSVGNAPDDPAALRQVAAATRGVDLLVTTGGASVGEHDLVRDVLGADGLELDFWQIAMRPGKPLMVGRYRGTPMVGLPGNPVSTLVCALLFLQPALDRLSGAAAPTEAASTARLGMALPKNDQRQDYLRSKLARAEDGTLEVFPFEVQDSSMMRLLSAADCLVVRPPHAPAIAAGANAPIVPFPGGVLPI